MEGLIILFILFMGFRILWIPVMLIFLWIPVMLIFLWIPVMLIFYASKMLEDRLVKSELERLVNRVKEDRLVKSELERLVNRATELSNSGRRKEAIDVATQAYHFLCNHFAENDSLYYQTLANLGKLHQHMRNYDTALSMWQKITAITLKLRFPDEQKYAYAVSLKGLADVYFGMENFIKAEALYLQMLEIFNSLRRSQTAHNLSEPKRSQDMFHAFEGSTKMQKMLREATVSVLKNLTRLYIQKGDIVQAESHYRRALTATRLTYGEKHDEVAVILTSGAEVYLTMGDNSEAESLLGQAIEIHNWNIQQNSGKAPHPNVEICLANLGVVYVSMGKYHKAEPLLQQALEFSRRQDGETHPAFAVHLSHLGMLYYQMNDVDKAEKYLQQALDIVRMTLGANHSRTANMQINLGVVCNVQGKYERGASLISQGLKTYHALFGGHHPHESEGHQALATAYAATGRTDEAFELMIQASTIDDALIDQIFAVASESQRSMYLNQVYGRLHETLSLISQYLRDHADAIHTSFDLVLKRKALGSEGLAVQQQTVLSGRYPALKPTFDQLFSLRQRIAEKFLAGPGAEDPHAHILQIAEWTRDKQVLEAELVRQIPEMKLNNALQHVNRQSIAQILPKGTALVEFVSYKPYNFQAIPAQGEEQWKPDHYLAFVMRSGEPENVTMFDFGDAEPINRKIADYRIALTGQTEDRGVSVERDQKNRGAFTSGKTVSQEDSAIRIGRQLRTLLFDPLTSSLGDCQEIFFSPDGELTRLPFEVLPTENGQRLIDTYHFRYLSVGRDVLRFQAEHSGQATEPLVIAAPNFDLTGAQNSKEQEHAKNKKTPDSTDKKRAEQDSRQAGLHFDPLPGTQEEGTQIAEMFGVSPLMGDDVLENTLKQHRSPGILHIASHGFFLPVQNRDMRDLLLHLLSGFPSPDKQMNPVEQWGRLGYGMANPLLRSGVALAGANTWLKEGVLPPEAEDAILNSVDVSGMDLFATELVVLSACETGLGDIKVGEGVIGLRRAFVLAGAKTLVMSLWKVPDKQTQELMVDFYQRILAGEPRAEALRQAQLAIKEKYPDPFYWGAFICQGDPGPLSEMNKKA